MGLGTFGWVGCRAITPNHTNHRESPNPPDPSNSAQVRITQLYRDQHFAVPSNWDTFPEATTDAGECYHHFQRKCEVAIINVCENLYISISISL